MLLNCCTQHARKFGKPSSGHRTGKGQFSFQSQEKANAKECSNYHTIALISHSSKVMLKILQVRLQQYENQKLPDVQAGFRGAEEPEIELPTSNIRWIIEKVREFQKNIYFCFIDKVNLTVRITTDWKILKVMGIPDHLTCLL